MKSPSITVLMPAYNAERYVGLAVESILGQTYSDFEFVIVDDGSVDGTRAIVEGYARRDARITVVATGHRGLSRALNAGLAAGQAPYVARMDADDESHPARFDRQLAYFRARPRVDICGTWMTCIGGGSEAIWRYPTDDATIRCSLIFGPAVAHPTVMMRRDVFDRGGAWYREEYGAAEDYDLWTRLASRCRFANLPSALVRYRLHEAQASRRAAREVVQDEQRIRFRELTRLGVEPTAAEMVLHEALSSWRFERGEDFLARATAWLNTLRAANGRSRAFPEPAFSRVLAQRWFAACRAAASSGWRAWQMFVRSPLRMYALEHPRAFVGFTLRCARDRPRRAGA